MNIVDAAGEQLDSGHGYGSSGTQFDYQLLYDEKLPEGWAFIANLNPLVPMLALYRSAILAYPFEMSDLILSAAWALVVAIGAVTVFVRFEGKMARYL